MNMQMKKALTASSLAVALVSVGLASGCAARTETYTGVQTPGIMTQPVEDTLKAAAEKAAAEKAEKALAAQREAAKKAAEEAADEAALDGGEIVEDANAPEGTVAVKAADGTTRYVAADKAQKSVDSGKTAPKKSESASNGGGSNSGSSNAGNSSNSGSSNKGNSGSSNSGSSSNSGNSGSNSGSASKPAPAPEPEPAPAPEPEPAPEPDHSGDHVMNEGSTRGGQCLDCGWSGATNAHTCPSCGSSEFVTGAM